MVTCVARSTDDDDVDTYGLSDANDVGSVVAVANAPRLGSASSAWRPMYEAASEDEKVLRWY